MADEQCKVDILFGFRRSGDVEALNSFKKLQETIQSNKATAANLKQEFTAVRNEINKLDDNATKVLIDNTDNARKIAQQTQVEYAQLAGEIRGAANAAESLGKSTQKSVDIQRNGSQSSGGSVNFGILGRTTSALGLDGIGNIANTVDDIKDLVEQVGELGKSAKEAGGVASLAGEVTGLGIAGIAAGAGLAAFSLIMAEVQRKAEEARKATEAAFDGSAEYYRIIVTGTKEDVEAARKAQKEKYDIANAQLKDLLPLQAQLKDLTGQFLLPEEVEKRKAAIKSQLADLGFDTSKFNVDVLDEQIKSLQTTVSTTYGNMERYDAALNNNVTAINDAAKAQDDATQQATENTKNFVSELKRYSDLQQQLKEASAAVTSAEKDRKLAIQKRAQEDLRAIQISRLESQIEKAKADEEAKARKDRIAALRSESGQVEADVIAKSQAKRAEIEARYMDTQLKVLNRYLTAEKNATENYNADRVHKLESLYLNLKELAAKGDVAAFVTTKRSGLQDIRQSDENFGRGAQQRLQSYQEESRAAQNARDQQLNELKASGEKEVTERKAQIAEKIKLEQKAGEQQMSLSQVLQQQLANLRQQFARQDLEARRRSEDEAYQVQIGKLRERQNAITQTLVNTFNPAVSGIYNLGTSVIDFINRVRQAAAAPVQSLTGSAGRDLRAGRDYITAFAGGTKRVPVSGVYHLDAEEAVLNKREAAAYRAGRLPGFASGNRQTIININNPIFGEIVTPNVMHTQINEVVAAFPIAVNGGATT